MLYVELNRANYEYEIGAMIRSFFSDDTVSIITPECSDEKKNAASGNYLFVITIFDCEASIYYKDKIYELKSENETVFREDFKQFFYKLLCDLTGKTLPWGNLSGVRPTKIVYNAILDGMSDSDIKFFLKEKHFVSDEKADLAIKTAKRELKLVSKFNSESDYSLYVNIPFCPTRCLYCSFTSYAIGVYKKYIDEYIKALKNELDFIAEEFKDKKLTTIYMGGGTPTSLSADNLKDILDHIKEKFDLSSLREFCVEAGRADSITEEKLTVLKNAGVDRISVNPQTFNQESLDFIGRRASCDQVIEAFKLARKIGFNNINMDLILGLPGEGKEKVQKTLDKVLELKPDSLTCHSLAIKSASDLAKLVKAKEIELISNTDEVMEMSYETANKLGLEPYYLYRQKNMSGNFENVGFSEPQKECLYNILIMEELQTIMAAGAGAISKTVTGKGENSVIKRQQNIKDPILYIQKISEMIEAKRELLKDTV